MSHLAIHFGTQARPHGGAAPWPALTVWACILLAERASLARYALNRGDMTTVSGALTEAERLDPDSGRVHLGHGYAEAMQGRYERAREEFETALRLDPMRCGEDAREQIRKIDVLLDKR